MQFFFGLENTIYTLENGYFHSGSLARVLEIDPLATVPALLEHGNHRPADCRPFISFDSFHTVCGAIFIKIYLLRILVQVSDEVRLSFTKS